MRYKPFGRSGVELPVIGQGTWNLPERGAARREAVSAMRRGIELGMTHIDTAEMYGAGAIETLVGEAIRGIAREQLFIASKVLPSNATYRGTIEAAQRSLDRLQCEYLDLYMLHWPSEHPLEETMRALAELRARGIARFIGVSNFDTDGMIEAAGYLRDVPLACNQVLYNLGERAIEHDLLPAAMQRGIAVVAYTPFGRGQYLRHSAGRAVLEAIGRKHEASVAQVVLAFLTRDRSVFTIPKAASVAHVEENAAAAELALDDDDIAAIDAAYPRGRRRALATL